MKNKANTKIKTETIIKYENKISDNSTIVLFKITNKKQVELRRWRIILFKIINNYYWLHFSQEYLKNI